jgi:hypothetical protein
MKRAGTVAAARPNKLFHRFATQGHIRAPEKVNRLQLTKGQAVDTLDGCKNITVRARSLCR